MVFEWAFPRIEEPFDRWCDREGIRNYRKYSKPLPDISECGGKREQADPVQQLIYRLEHAKPGQYLLVGHPGYDDEFMRRLGSPEYPSAKVVSDRVQERLMFTHPDVLEICARLGIRPIRYDEAQLL